MHIVYTDSPGRVSHTRVFEGPFPPRRRVVPRSTADARARGSGESRRDRATERLARRRAVVRGGAGSDARDARSKERARWFHFIFISIRFLSLIHI